MKCLDPIIATLEHLKNRECRVILRGGQVPKKGSLDAAGYDLTSAENLVVRAHARALVHTGIWVAPPRGTHIEIRPRSGLALQYGITVLNTPGTVDADYRGELMVILFNTSENDFSIRQGDRIAQAVFMKHLDVKWRQVQGFDTTARGTQGFGSSGIS